LPLEQVKIAIKKREPIKDKILDILQGNHERKLWRFGDLAKEVADALGVQYGTYTDKMTVNDSKGNLMYKVYHTHGFKSIFSSADDPLRRKVNMELILKRHLKFKAADCAVMIKGHCFSEDTEILTTDGWKFYYEISPNEEVLTFNTKNELAEWQQIDAKYVYEDKFNEIYSFQGRATDFCVTGDHRIIVKRGDKKKRWGEITANDLLKLNSSVIVPTSGKSGLSDYPIDDNMVRLIGWIVSEGHFRSYGPIQLFQNADNAYKISDILDALGIKYTTYLRKFKGRKFNDSITGKEYQTQNDNITFYIGTKEVHKIKEYIISKNLPKIAFNFSDRQFDILLNALVSGDGNWNKGKRSGFYYTNSSDISDTLQALCISHGWRCSIALRRNNQFVVSFAKYKQKALFKKHMIYTTIDNPKTVWCVSVPNGTVFVRRNGKAIVLGNTHKLLVSKPEVDLFLYDDGKQIKQGYTSSGQNEQYIHPDARWYGNSGSFLKLFGKGVSGYAEIFELDPVELGFLVLKVRQKRIVSLDPYFIGI